MAEMKRDDAPPFVPSVADLGARKDPRLAYDERLQARAGKEPAKDDAPLVTADPPYTDAEIEELVTWANEIDSGWTAAKVRVALEWRRNTACAALRLMRRAEARGFARAVAELAAPTMVAPPGMLAAMGAGPVAPKDKMLVPPRPDFGTGPAGGSAYEARLQDDWDRVYGPLVRFGEAEVDETKSAGLLASIGTTTTHPTSDIAETCSACGEESEQLLTTGAAGSTSLCVGCYHTAAEEALRQHALDREAWEKALAARDGDVAHLNAENEQLTRERAEAKEAETWVRQQLRDVAASDAKRIEALEQYLSQARSNIALLDAKGREMKTQRDQARAAEDIATTSAAEMRATIERLTREALENEVVGAEAALHFCRGMSEEADAQKTLDDARAKLAALKDGAT